MDLGAAASTVMQRYIQVQENYYPQVRHLRISPDGLRVVSRSVNFLCYNGQPAAADGTEQFRAAWGLKVTARKGGRGGISESILGTGLVFQTEWASLL